MRKSMFILALMFISPCYAEEKKCGVLEGSWGNRIADEQSDYTKMSLRFKKNKFEYLIREFWYGGFISSFDEHYHQGKWICKEKIIFMKSKHKNENRKNGYFSVIEVIERTDEHIIIYITEGINENESFMLYKE